MHKLLSHSLSSRQIVLSIILTLIIIGLGGIGWYGYLRASEMSRQIADLQTELAQTADLLQARIADATTSLSSLSDQIKEEQRSVQNKVGDLTGTLSTLEKLSKTDRELLAKYSKVFFLSEHYEPARVVEIPERYRYDEKSVHRIIPEVLPYLTKLLEAAEEDDIEIYVQSAYRSFNEQSIIKSAYTVTYGAGTANTFSADQGYSEHQLGTTVDFITTGLSGKLAGFERTEAYEWLLDNAYRYGFVLSYPKNNGYYIFEPWHWRFVGVKLATDLHTQDKEFYELDQRTIDTYLVSIFD